MKRLWMLVLVMTATVLRAEPDSAVPNAGQGTKPLDPRQLMQEVIDRYQGETVVNSLRLVTCEYAVVDGRVRCASKPRVRVLQSFAKHSGKGLKDTRGFTHIIEPVSDRGISILQYDYEESGKDTDQWLYLPELQRVKRVASDGSAPKKGSLFGSEFALEDLERIKVEDYVFRLREITRSGEEEVAVVEQQPVPARAHRTNYGRVVTWIDLERRLILKTEYYGHDQKLLKVRQGGDIRKVDGIWTITKDVMRNLETQRISELSFVNVVYNTKLKDEMFTQRMLEDAVFRESMLPSVKESEGH